MADQNAEDVLQPQQHHGDQVQLQANEQQQPGDQEQPVSKHKETHNQHRYQADELEPQQPAHPPPSKAGKRKRDFNTNQMEVIDQLRGNLPHGLHALLLDGTCWVACDEAAVHSLNTLCLGNLDGGAGTAADVRQHLAAAGEAVAGTAAVRLSLDEAFFMAHALRLLTVHDLVDGRAVRLDATVRREGRMGGQRVHQGGAAGARLEADC